jgi:hypothetical protein
MQRPFQTFDNSDTNKQKKNVPEMIFLIWYNCVQDILKVTWYSHPAYIVSWQGVLDKW